MKKKILIALLLVLVCSFLVTAFAITASAEDGITIRYVWADLSTRQAIEPNADGTYTLGTSKLSGDGTATLADGTVVDKVFYGWYTLNGEFYEPGATVAFKEDTDVFEAYGYEVTTAEDMIKLLDAKVYTRLGADIETSSSIWAEWGTAVLDLNGHNVTCTSKDKAVHIKRGAFHIIGEGTFTHAPSTLNTNDGSTSFIIFERHGYADTNNPQVFVVGTDVEIVTPYNFVRISHTPNMDNMPNMYVAGTVTAKTLIRAGVLVNATIKILPTANITITGNDVFAFTDESGSSTYANISIAGNITLQDAEALLFDDFVLTSSFSISQITSGSFTVSSNDVERISMFLPNTLMLKGTENEDGTTTYNVVAADCVHNWILDEENTIIPTANTTGIDAFVCSLCQSTKQTITVYSPANVEITVTVNKDGVLTDYTVLAGDVYNFEFSGFAAAAKCYIAGLKDTSDFLASEIVGIEIPVGVVTLNGFASESVETIVILDGTTIVVSDLSTLTALKTIEIKAATVTFSNILSTTLEKISSNTTGATVTFESNSFKSKLNFKTLEMSTQSTYNFATNCFNAAGITEVVMPDDSVINFTGDAAFYACPNLSYVYFGKNCIADKKIYKKPFDCAYALETVVLMDITYIDQYVFCCAGNATSTNANREGQSGLTTPLKVYHHGESISINANTFVNRTTYGVEFYTNCELTSLSNCKYLIYNGIGHAYTQGTITESTCAVQGTAGYATDCPCGIDYRTNTFTTYSSYDSSLNNVTHEAYGTEEILLPLSTVHTMGTTLADIVYTNYFENGTNYYYCSVCNTATLAEEAPSATPLFVAVGYSHSEEEDTKGISHTIKVNINAIEDYKKLGHDFHYGVVAAIYSDGTPIIGIDTTKESAVMADMSKNAFERIQIKITGITQEKLNTALNCCGYAIENGETPVIKYLCGSETLDAAESVTYALVVEKQAEAIVPTKIEE